MAKKKKKPKKPMQIWKIYEGGKAKNPECPKCGKGIFMAIHKDRKVCGKCGYSEFSSEQPEKNKE